MLRRMIREAGLKRVFITNVVRCNPRDRAGRNRDPGAVEIANCRDHLRAELAVARPRVVVCLGRIAWRELAGREVAFSPGGRIELGGVRYLAMYHPGYVIRGAYSIREYARDFARLAQLAIDSVAVTPRS